MALFGKKRRKESAGDLTLLLRSRQTLVSGLGELGNSAFWSCVMQLAKLYATLPWAAYSKDGNGNRKDASTAVRELLDRPNRWMTSYEFRFIMALNFELTGEAYAIMERTQRGVPASLLPVPTGSVVTRIGESGERIYSVNGVNYTDDRILAIRHTPSGLTSVLSPAAHASSDLDLERKCKQMQMEYFDGASVIGNLIKVPSSFTPEQKEQIKAGFDTTNGFRNIVTDNRVEITPIQVNSADVSKLVSASQWSAKQVAARFGVPGFFVGLTEGAYNNLEDQNIYFMTYCLNPRLRAWEEALTAQLCNGADYIEFNREGLLQANSAAKISYYNAALNNGWMNRNEIRAKENLPSLGKDGEVFFMQTAMGTVENIINGNYGGGGMNPWDANAAQPEKPEISERKPERDPVEEKRIQERRFVEDVQGQAMTARRKLERAIRSQVRDDLAAFRARIEAGEGFETALQSFSKDLEDIAAEHKVEYMDIYRDVARRLKPIVTKQCDMGTEVDETELDAFVDQYVDSLMGRQGGLVAKRIKKTNGDMDAFEEEASDLTVNYPVNESTEEVNRSSNALSLYMFTALGVVAYHIVSNADCCAFCSQMDGKVASVSGYILTKGSDAPDGEGGVRRIDKNYRHPPFHTFCACHVAPGR